MSRSVAEWIGKNADSKPPAPVVLRIWRREDGVCHLSGRKIAAGEDWHLEHKTALSLGGENRERNLFPALIDPHKDKSAEEAAVRAKADAVTKRHIGIAKDVIPIKSAKFPISPRTARNLSRGPKACAGTGGVARQYQERS